jgi:sigma-B regulation protein RsbU (phosphoserine phosphatase)
MVAGDYYDVFEVGPDQVVVALGDAVGKGMGAALIMAELHGLIRSHFRHGPTDLAGLMKEVNDDLLASTPADFFVTLFVGILDLALGQLRYVNGGHPRPLLIGRLVKEPVRLSEGGTVVGAFPGEDFREEQVELPQECLLALFSDGLTEAGSETRSLFGEKGVAKVLCTFLGCPGKVVLRRLLEAVDHHADGDGEADDISVIIVRRTLR